MYSAHDQLTSFNCRGCTGEGINSLVDSILHSPSFETSLFFLVCNYVKCGDYLAVLSTKGLIAVPLIAGNRVLKSPLNSHIIEIVRDITSLQIQMCSASIVLLFLLKICEKTYFFQIHHYDVQPDFLGSFPSLSFSNRMVDKQKLLLKMEEC